MRYILTALPVGIIVFLGICMSAQSEKAPQRFDHGSTPTRIFAAGRVEGATREVRLRPAISERIVELSVEEGQIVTQGHVLLRLNDKRHEHELALAAAHVKLADGKLDRLKNGARREERSEAESLYHAKLAELQQAQLVLQRLQELRAESAIPEQELDDQESRVQSLMGHVRAAKARADLLNAAARPDELRIAQAQVEAARAGWELAKTQLEWTRLRAPFAGQVLKIHTEVGELAGPDSPPPAIVMADTRQLRVHGFVEEMDAPRVKVGMTATVVADGLPGQNFTGRVIRLSPRMSHKELWTDDPAERFDTKIREVWIELDEAGGLLVGLRVDVMIDTGMVAPADGAHD